MADHDLPKIVAIVGPTASGKSDFGLKFAKEHDGEVICLDSRTIYRELDIGTAKPVGIPGPIKFTPGDTALPDRGLIVDGVMHWGLNLVDPRETFSVQQFQAFADAKISDLISRNKLPVLVGGTGLYLRAIVDRPSFSDTPPNPEWRSKIAGYSIAQLIDEIESLDPDAIQTLDLDNRRRLERALEILMATGRPLKEAQTFGDPIYSPTIFGINLDRETLYARINSRVDAMIAAGLVDEVRTLVVKYGPDAPALTGIGYREIVEWLAKVVDPSLDRPRTLPETIEKIKTNTRHYARRQLTWFNADKRIEWIGGK